MSSPRDGGFVLLQHGDFIRLDGERGGEMWARRLDILRVRDSGSGCNSIRRAGFAVARHGDTDSIVLDLRRVLEVLLYALQPILIRTPGHL